MLETHSLAPSLMLGAQCPARRPGTRWLLRLRELAKTPSPGARRRGSTLKPEWSAWRRLEATLRLSLSAGKISTRPAAPARSRSTSSLEPPLWRSSLPRRSSLAGSDNDNNHDNDNKHDNNNDNYKQNGKFRYFSTTVLCAGSFDWEFSNSKKCYKCRLEDRN